jgi:mRNA deadenylase 3'-5' endonuclease subunit Ccr4
MIRTQPETRIATWNLLAPEYVRVEGGRDFYRDVHPWDEWDRRRPRILQDVSVLADSADLLCLQEVSEPFWREALAGALEESGFASASEFDPRYRVGVALAWRRSVFALERETAKYPHPEAQRGRIVAQQLRHLRGGHSMRAASAHLKWSPSADERRTTLDEAISRVSRGDAVDAEVLVGDLNFDPKAHDAWPAWAALGWRTTHPEDTAPTWAADGRCDRLDAILYRGGLRGIHDEPLARISAAPGLPSAEMPSDHIPLIAHLTTE